jgi:pimeloyl-ACP methyl ester carboxylesterase
MISKRFFLRASTLILISFSLLTSCKKENKPVTYSHYISKQLVVTYTKENIGNLLDLISISVPDVNQFKPLVSGDVTVYKLVYKTTVKGQEINASGLVCVPVTPGKYPALSFQNGANTVNAFAPSESPQDYSYQLIEMMASMNYIVVIADYPGFGESSQIPHPYLIEEPTTKSLIDMFYAVKELTISELPGISLNEDYYLLGYSQGGWATLGLHKAMEENYSSDFNLRGSACGAGPYDINLLMQNILDQSTYPMPVYLGYILNSYIAYNQFPNPVTDFFNEPYASRLSSLYNGLQTTDQINSQLTTSISGLITSDFLNGYATSARYSQVRVAFSNNSISAWHTNKPLLLLHGGNDTEVYPVTTENMYSEMIQAGTSPDICSKIIVPGVDHGDGAVPCMIKGFLFLENLKGL